MMFAELSAFDPPILISAVLGSLMFLLMGLNAAAESWRNIKDKPTGAEVMEKAREEFQPKGDYLSWQEFNQFKRSIEGEMQAILKAGERREQHLASLIEALDSRLDELPAKMVKHMTETIELYEKFQQRDDQR